MDREKFIMMGPAYQCRYIEQVETENKALKKQIADLRKEMEWVAVEDRLPEVGQEVFVRLSDNVSVHLINSKCRIEVDEVRELSPSDGGGLSFIRYYNHNITHWKPLPPEPEQEQKGVKQ